MLHVRKRILLEFSDFFSIAQRKQFIKTYSQWQNTYKSGDLSSAAYKSSDDEMPEKEHPISDKVVQIDIIDSMDNVFDLKDM